jgi:hypothetical protein
MDERARCSRATLDGRYLVAFDGTGLDARNRPVPVAGAGYEVFDGNGNVTSVGSFSENGTITRNARFSGTYTVNADCTGTATFDGSHYDLFIAPDGSMFTWVQTDRGSRLSGFELRGTAKRVGD